MKYLVTSQEMKRFDQNTIEVIGIPGMVLMERAALKVRDAILRSPKLQHPSIRPASVLIMTGYGNNGGDGLALARLLSDEGMAVTVWCVGDSAVKQGRASEQWIAQRRILDHYDVSFCDRPGNTEYTIIVDALFGVGLSREVTGEFQDAIELFNQMRGHKIALDIPSGLSSDDGSVLGICTRVDETYTFAFLKRGLCMYPGCEYSGVVHVCDIGITERSFLQEVPSMFAIEPGEWLPNRRKDGNKGSFGKVLVVAGSNHCAGAALLACRAAFRVGAGMVKCITHESNRIIFQETLPEAMFGSYDELETSLSWGDVLLIGPGLGTGEEAYHCLESVIIGSDLPLVIDADGLNLLAKQPALIDALSGQRDRAVILTPHVGELARLTGRPVAELKHSLCHEACKLAEAIDCIVVAKDARTYICKEGNCPEHSAVCMNLTGNNGMATAGSGDALAGVIAGLLGQYDLPDSAFRAACCGVCMHGFAGDIAAKKLGEVSVMAGDLVDCLSEAFRVEVRNS